MKRHHPFLFLISLFLLFASTLEASNGLNGIGFGTESSTMGGADLAVARDTSALNTNPAGLIQIPKHRLDFYTAAIFSPNVRHHDSLGNNAGIENTPSFVGTFAYAHHLNNYPVTLGFGLFAQGGAGYEYPETITPFGSKDDLTSLFRIAKLMVGGAWGQSDGLSLGASFALIYSDSNQKVFPKTSVFNPTNPAQSFFGYELRDMRALSHGLKLGARYQLNEQIRLGMAYTTKTTIKLKDGQFISNMSGSGLGKVNYRDVKAEGINLAQEIGVGIAIQATTAWLVTFEVNWLDWSDAVQSATLTAKDPDNPTAPSTIAFTDKQDWKDQYVIALGFSYAFNEQVLLRGGYNYGRNPIPDQNLNPLLAAIAEHHLTGGVGYRINKRWNLDAGIEYLFNNKVTYNNPASPFGPGSAEGIEYIALHFTLSRQW